MSFIKGHRTWWMKTRSCLLTLLLISIMMPVPVHSETDRGLIFDTIELRHETGWFQPEYGAIRPYEGKNKNNLIFELNSVPHFSQVHPHRYSRIEKGNLVWLGDYEILQFYIYTYNPISVRIRISSLQGTVVDVESGGNYHGVVAGRFPREIETPGLYWIDVLTSGFGNARYVLEFK